MGEKRHPGITMHKITFGGGFVGLLFTVGSTLIFLVGLPALWYFVALAFALGVGVAVVLRIFSDKSADHNKPLSIMVTPEKAEHRRSPQRQKWHRLFLVAARVFAT